MIRANKHETLTELAEHASVPVINGLTDRTPSLPDRRRHHDVRGGEWARSRAARWPGPATATTSPPPGSRPRRGSASSWRSPARRSSTPRTSVLDWAKREGADIELTDDPDEAVTGADCVVTDTWVSMGQQNDAARRKQLLAPYAVDDAADEARRRRGAIFMHCLPAYRGHEVTAAVIDGPQSVGLGRGREPAARAEGDPGLVPGSRLNAAAPTTAQSSGAAGRRSRAAVPHGAVGRDRPRHPAGLGGRHHAVAARLSRARQPRAGRGAGADRHAGQRAEDRRPSSSCRPRPTAPLDFLVADFEAPGKVRGYASFDKADAALAEAKGRGDQGALLGKGHLAMTIDPGGEQGPLPGHRRARRRAAGRCGAHLFPPVRAAPDLHPAGGGAPLRPAERRRAQRSWRWRAGGLMIQQLPREGGKRERRRDAREEPGRRRGRDWNRARHLAATVEDHELLDPDAVARAPALPAVPRGGRARDARDRARRRVPLLARAHPRLSQPLRRRGARADMREPDGGFTVTCEFCSRKYRFSSADIG